MGGVDSDFGRGIAVDGSGNVYTAGSFSGTVDFDPGPGMFDLTCIGSFDIFVSKLSHLQPTNVGGTTSFRGYGPGSSNALILLFGVAIAAILAIVGGTSWYTRMR